MAWIRLDCGIETDEWFLTLDGWERSAWMMLLLHVKGSGARGSVAATLPKILAARWFIPVDSVASMLRKAIRDKRVREDGGRWYIANWAKYQEDHRSKAENGESSGDAANGTTTTTTVPNSTVQHCPTANDFDAVWSLYPSRSGKKAALKHFLATVKTPEDLHRIRDALANYLKSYNVSRGFVKNGSTWFNEWQDWIEPTDVMMKGSANGTTQQSGSANSATARANFRVANADEEVRRTAESIAATRRARDERAGSDSG